MAENRKIVTLLTDFQDGSAYPAQMKGVIWSRNSEIQIADVTHQIPAQNILAGALTLANTVPFFPAGTIHAVVVDPGVGSNRDLVAAICQTPSGRQTVLCPDNGLLSILREKCPILEVFVLENTKLFRPTISSTFHGRDILAPCAAFLANGGSAADLGREKKKEELVSLDVPKPRFENGEVHGEILLADSFGNLISNVSRDFLYEYLPSFTWTDGAGEEERETGTRELRGGRQSLKLSVQARRKENVSSKESLEGERLMDFELVRTYSDLAPGENAALFGSQDFLELAVVNGSAEKELCLGPGSEIRIWDSESEFPH